MKVITNAWYHKKATWVLLFWPLEYLFVTLAKFKKKQLLKQQWQASCPVIIVGNISIGGTGKSPVSIYLIEILQQQGYKVGVVSRGYGALRKDFPYQVQASDDAGQSGDEPLMIVKRTGVNLVIDPDRVRACQYLLANNDCDLIISDDGLQHYRMGRDIEIAVIDGKRGLGNGHCLPVGPLREFAERLNSVDFVIVNGEQNNEFSSSYTMQIRAQGWYRIKDQKFISLTDFQALIIEQQAMVHGVAGIGNPQRFYDSLHALGIDAVQHSFADHHQYSAANFDFVNAPHKAFTANGNSKSNLKRNHIICMTQKDAVKCVNYAPENSYYLKVKADIDASFKQNLLEKLAALQETKNI
ncbi:MAG: tetraacyldisaccharide 4'-kinase [Oceanospirillaceae bacterium]|jgi:tetraacyldisaccharide 4'-kinase